MAIVTKSAAVAYVETEFGEKCERFNVVGFEIMAAIVTAFDACVVIAFENGTAPFLIRE